MKKIILIIFFLIISLLNADDVGECCTQYGGLNSGASGEIIKEKIGGGVWSNAESDTFINENGGSNGTRTCRSFGVVDTHSLRDEHVSNAQWNDNYEIDRFVYNLVLKYPCICNEDAPPSPPVEEDPTLWKKIYEGNPALAPSECYEPDGINFKSYNFKTIACGDETMRCYKKFVETLVCDATFTNLNINVESECTQELADYANTYDNVNGYFRTIDNQNVCCAKWDIRDNNDTGTDPTPDACESPRIDRPEYNWVHHAGITDHNTCVSLAVGHDRWWTFPNTGTVERCCIGKRKENYVAPSCSELKPSHAGWTYIDVSSSSITNSNSCQNSITGGGTSEYGFYFVANSQNNCCFKIDYRGVGSSGGGTDNGGNSDNGATDNGSGSNGGGSSGGGSGGGTTKTNDILSDIKSDINESNNALDSISKELNASNGTLNKIEENTRFLKDLKSTFEDSEKSLSDIKEEFSNLSNILNNSQSSVSSALSGMLGSLNGFSSPVFQGQGQHVFNTSVFGQNIEFDFSMVEQLKQYFDIVFMLLLVYFNFKMYRWIIEVLLKMGV